MKRYRHKATGDIYHQTSLGFYYSNIDPRTNIPYSVVENSNDWELIKDIIYIQSIDNPSKILQFDKRLGAFDGKLYKEITKEQYDIIYIYYKYNNNYTTECCKVQFDGALRCPKCKTLLGTKPEKDYEILSFTVISSNRPRIKNANGLFYFPIDCLNRSGITEKEGLKKWNIHSVKRLSDG